PYIGQTFSTKQEAREFYNSYAKQIGFSVRTGTSRLSSLTREQQKIMKMKEGNSIPESDDSDSTVRESKLENNDEGNDIENAEKKKKMDGGKKRKREKMHHTDCKARMIVKLIGDRWHVIFFAPNHNHDLVVKPSLKKFMRSHKGIPQAEKDFIEMLHGCNLSTGRIMQLMNEFYGSAQLIKLDAEHRVESLFWVDGAARHAYIESYHNCLFETFLEAMKGKTPVSIITDQDAAMRCAIAHFTGTIGPVLDGDEELEEDFKECMNHTRRAPEGQKRAEVAIADLQACAAPFSIPPNLLCQTSIPCIYSFTPRSSTISGHGLPKPRAVPAARRLAAVAMVAVDDLVEFEEKWDAMINKHGLTDNVHFQRLYGLRSSFAPAYYMHWFYPFLQSTHRSEGFNAVLKKYVNPNMSVLNFVKQYQKIQDKCLVAQDGKDFKTDDRDRRRWSRYPIEKHASTVYTKNLFYRFSKEFEKTAEYDVKPEGQIQYYLVPNNKFVYGYGKRAYLVTTIEDEGSYYCECSKFDRDGLICCHIMKIMTRLGVKTIPNHFILKRWTQELVPENENGGVNANSHVQADFIARGMPLNNRKTMWFANLSTAFAGLAVEGSVSRGTYDLMDSHIKMIRSALDEIKKRKKPSRQRVVVMVCLLKTLVLVHY
ncbi:hypothetical protein PVAP13_5KG545721, partial [Panicum virgatum]